MSRSRARILLTGAAGFIGRAITTELTAAGHDVIGVDSYLVQAHGAGAAHDPEIVVGDVRDESFLFGQLDGVDVVCHQAAMVGLGVHAGDAPGYAGHNVLGTATVLSAMACHGITRFVQASSMVVYGEGRYACVGHGVQPGLPRSAEDLALGQFEPACPRCGSPMQWLRVTEDAALDPRNSYAASKVAQEHFASSWARQVGGTTTSLRYHNVYGPGMPRNTPYAGVASIFRSALENGDTPTVLEDGGQMRDFVNVSDVALANRLALERALDIPDGTFDIAAFNVASGVPHSVGDFADSLADEFGGPVPVVVGGGRIGDVRHIVADPGLAHRELGFRALVDFGSGVAEFAHAPLREAAALA